MRECFFRAVVGDYGILRQACLGHPLPSSFT